LKQRREAAKDYERLLIDEMLAHAPTLQGRLGALLPEPAQILKVRHHGDFHLGQMLIAKDDIFIIDFEGEPRRTLEERRRKAPAARDVAGLIRSIDYSTTAALDRALKVTSDEQGKLASALNAWRDRATGTFLGAYGETIGRSQLWPGDPAVASRLLNFFLLEKAIYEIEYELAHRPDWLRVPLTGALRILSQPMEAS
jgi:maltose alpha-D-glucosyltransferase/alpha-amylase